MFFSLTLSLCSAASLLHNEDNNSCTAQAHADDKIIHQDLKQCCAEFQRRPYKNSISFDLQTLLNAACRCSKILKLFCGHKNRFLVTTAQSDRIRKKFGSFQTLPKKSQAIRLTLSSRLLRGWPLCLTWKHLYLGFFSPSRDVCDLWKAARLTSVLTYRPGFTVLAPSHRWCRAVPLAWHCHHPSTMKHPTATSPTLHPSEQTAPTHSVVVNPSAPQLHP